MALCVTDVYLSHSMCVFVSGWLCVGKGRGARERREVERDGDSIYLCYDGCSLYIVRLNN